MPSPSTTSRRFARLLRSLGPSAVPTVLAVGALSAHDIRLVPAAFAGAPFADVFVKGTQGISLVRADSLDVVNTVRAYHRALAGGDSLRALALLAPDAVVLESGGIETREEYRSQHLPADIRSARAVPSQYGPLIVRVLGDVAWAASTSVTQGESRGRQVNSSGAELMVLVRASDGWKIAAIHWSSRQRR